MLQRGNDQFMSRRLAFVCALAFVPLVACHGEPTVETGTRPCPTTKPGEGKACTNPRSGGCTYSAATATHPYECLCTRDGWSCRKYQPSKGPLPPPDLGVA